MELPPADVPEPDATLEPAGFIVDGDGGDRIHFLDWGGPAAPTRTAPGDRRDPRARRRRRWVVGTGRPPARPGQQVGCDGRGDGPARSRPVRRADRGRRATTSTSRPSDVVAVAEGAGLLGDAGRSGRPRRVTGSARSWLPGRRRHSGSRCAGLVLVDGGWETLEAATGVDVDEFLRGLDEPPEVMRSLGAFLADRRAFDPATWDADQDRAALGDRRRDPCRSRRPVGPTACHRGERPGDVRLRPGVDPRRRPRPIVALIAAGDESGSREPALAEASATRDGAGRDPIAVIVVRGRRSQPDALPSAGGRRGHPRREPR